MSTHIEVGQVYEAFAYKKHNGPIMAGFYKVVEVYDKYEILGEKKVSYTFVQIMMVATSTNQEVIPVDERTRSPRTSDLPLHFIEEHFRLTDMCKPVKLLTVL